MHPYKVVPYECVYKITAHEEGMNNKAIFVLHTSLMPARYRIVQHKPTVPLFNQILL